MCKHQGMPHIGTRTRRVALAATAIGLLTPPVALAADDPVDGGARNPSNNASSGFSRETQIIGEIAQNQGGFAAGTGGYVTRQSNKSDSGGGAIYGCRAKAGTESCVAANNLANGDAFRFQSTESAPTIGRFLFGLNLSKPVAKPPFVTNGTGLVANLNADKLDGKSAEEFAAKTDLQDYLPKGSVLFARVASDGTTIQTNRGVPAGRTASVDTTGGNATVTVPFSGDISGCVATGSAASTPAGGAGPVVVTIGTDKSSVVATETGVTTPYSVSVQVTC